MILHYRLPKTSYLKMIDIWFIFTMFMPFTEVILHTISDYLRIKLKDLDKIKQEKVPVKTGNMVTVAPAMFSVADTHIMARKDKILQKLDLIKNIGIYCLPCIFVIFTITFISIGMYLKYNIDH